METTIEGLGFRVQRLGPKPQEHPEWLMQAVEKFDATTIKGLPVQSVEGLGFRVCSGKMHRCLGFRVKGLH